MKQQVFFLALFLLNGTAFTMEQDRLNARAKIKLEANDPLEELEDIEARISKLQEQENKGKPASKEEMAKIASNVDRLLEPGERIPLLASKTSEAGKLQEEAEAFKDKKEQLAKGMLKRDCCYCVFCPCFCPCILYNMYKHYHGKL